MKLIFSALLMLFQVYAFSQNNTITNTELKALVGSWTGSMVSTVFADGKSQHTYTTTLEVTDRQDSLMFSFTFTGEDGKQKFEKFPFRIYDNNSKLSFDSTQFDIAEVRRRGVRLSVYAEREGYDEKFMPIDYQDIFIIGPGILNITKGTRSGNAVDFAIRQRMSLTKK